MKIPFERFVYVGLGVTILTITFMNAVQYHEMVQLIASAKWVDHTNRVIDAVAAMRGSAKTAESAARGFALTGDMAFLDDLEGSVVSANRNEREIRTLTVDNPRQQQRLDKLEPLQVQRFRALADLVGMRRSSGDAAAASVQVKAGTAIAAAVESLSLEVQNEELALLIGRRSALEGGTNGALIADLAASVFSLLVLGLASALIVVEMRKRRKSETSLQHEKKLFTTLMDSVPEYIYFKDRESRFLRINAAMGRRLGVSEVTEATGKSDADYYSPEYARSTRADEKDVFQTGYGVIRKEELAVLTSDGRETWLESSRMPVADSDGSIVGTFGISRDITAGKQAEQAIESANAKLTEWNEQLESRNREIILLSEVVELLQTSVSEAEAERILLKFAPDLFPALSGALSMIKASRNIVERTVKWGDETLSAAIFLPDDCWALRRGRSHGSGNSSGRIKCAHLKLTFTGSFICVPMMAHGETIGVLHLLDGSHLGKSEARLATMVAERMGLAIANIRLREALKAQSIRDPLTGLFNRRYLEESLERELHRADRDKSTIGLIMADLDHFKRFNDTFGHEGGDAILKEFSALLLVHTRKEDIVCRYGGEEFLIVFPGASLEDAHNRAGDLLQAARKVGVILRGQELGPISVSMGVALYPQDASTVASVIRAADHALYKAKTLGRDCVVLAAAHPVSGGSDLDDGILTAPGATIGVRGEFRT